MFGSIEIKRGNKGVNFYVAFCTAMLFVCRRRVLYFSLMVLLMVTVLLCCQVEAIRVFPSNNAVDNKSKEDLLRKYFSGRTFGLNKGSQEGFDESKRKVPSCPDPLHN